MNRDELYKAFTRDFKLIYGKPIIMELPGETAWYLFMNLQLALRHPGNTGPSAEFVRKFALELQEKLAITPALRELAEKGWDPNYDE
jgi:hypothetical protein